jgi:wyosine [tRNA(Phe)-imidazoG37] synthetase (radical SAM superfamily)
MPVKYIMPATDRQRIHNGWPVTATEKQTMKPSDMRHVYGPVPSRRLGRSLGIDLVPFKVCTYDCIYCQLGRTTDLTLERKAYVTAENIMAELAPILTAADRPDYISLAGSGEPTLNSAIGEVIRRIKQQTDIPVAVLTNGALLWMAEVQQALLAADLVLPSLDAGDDGLFQKINRPHQALSFERMVDGLAAFTRRFAGAVWLEVLLLKGMTGTAAEVEKIAAHVNRINPARVQLNTVCRPPAETMASPLSSGQLHALGALFAVPVDIVSYDDTATVTVSTAENVRETDILAMLERRPCTADDVARGLGIHVNEALKHLAALVTAGRLVTKTNAGRNFYMTTEEHER